MPGYNSDDSRILINDQQIKDYFKNKEGLHWIDKEVDMIRDKFANKKNKQEKQIYHTIGRDLTNNEQKIKNLKDRKVEILKKELDIIREDIPLSDEFIDINNKIEMYEENIMIERSENESKSNELYEMFDKLADNRLIHTFLYPKTALEWLIKTIIYALSLVLTQAILFIIVLLFESYYKVKTKKIEEKNEIINRLKERNAILSDEIYKEILALEDAIINYRSNRDIEKELEEINIDVRKVDRRLNELEKNQRVALIDINSRIKRELKGSLDQVYKKKDFLQRRDIELGLAYRLIKKTYSYIDKNASIEEILAELKSYLDTGKASDDSAAINLYKKRIREEKQDVLNEIKRREELKKYKKTMKLKEKEDERKRIEKEKQAELEKQRQEKENQERKRKALLKEQTEKINELQEDIKNLDKKISSKNINEYQKRDMQEEREYLQQERLDLIKKRSRF